MSWLMIKSNNHEWMSYDKTIVLIILFYFIFLFLFFKGGLAKDGVWVRSMKGK